MTLQKSGTNYWPGMAEFKKSLCDENTIISSILRDHCQPWLHEPILDVGAGLGDIAHIAFPEKKAFLLDCNAEIKTQNLNHTIVQGDFFSKAKDLGTLGTLVFSHSLQYLDNDWYVFSAYIDKLNPSTIIAVTNENSGIFGTIMKWAQHNIPRTNIETSEIKLSQNYKLAASFPFSATFRSPSFKIMAQELLAGIVDAPSTETSIRALEQHLKTTLENPILSIKQTVSCFDHKI
jgi:hypothetical protein